MVKLLLEAKADVNVKEVDGWTALHHAARNGHEAVVKLLLEAEADVNAKADYEGETALHLASKGEHEAVVRLLLEKADVDAKTKDGGTALHWAVKIGSKAMVQQLLEKADVDAKDNDGRTALHLPARNRHKMVVWLLLQYRKEHGMAIHDEDMDAAAKLLTDFEGRIICDGCNSRIPNLDPHYHCSICNNDDFDLCQECIDNSVHCRDDGHRLIKVSL